MRVGFTTTDFLKLILPDEGYHCVASRNPGGPIQHGFLRSPEILAQAIAKCSAAGMEVYYGCAAYAERGSRKAANVLSVKSFWLDIDCGEGKPYAKPSEAAAATLAMVQKLGLPRPYFVGSGGGLHVYWPLTAPISPSDWKSTAELLKAAARMAGVDADPSRTADVASILRPIGTYNLKRQRREVRMLMEGDVSDHETVRQALVGFLGANAEPDPLGPMPDYLADKLTETDLKGEVRYEPALGTRIAEHCGVIGLVRDTRGNVDQPTWYRAIGVLVHTEEGRDLCHDWSQGHPDYTFAETESKISQALRYGPSTCERLGETQPSICGACPYQGKITSPIVLGRDIKPRNAPLLIPDETDSSKFKQLEMPEGYRAYNAGARWVLQYKIPTDPNSEEPLEDIWAPFCDTVFWPRSRIQTADGMRIEWEMIVKPGEYRRFVLDTETIAKGKDSLAGALGRHELTARPKMERAMEGYLRDWMTRLRETATATQSHQHFGWTEDKEFVLGDKLIGKDGDRDIVLRGAAKSAAPALTPAGSLDLWKSVIDRAYNHPGQEAYQFSVACGFAAPLLSMMKQVNGITVYAHSEGSGVGKTTAQRAALSIWGNWETMQLADNKVTANALWSMIGVYNTLPVCFDELTNQANNVASDMVFSVSSGRAKQRLRADGELRDNASNWCTIMLASGNNLLSEKLSLHRANAEAEISRLFEFTMRNTSPLTPNEALDLFPLLLENYGHAGEVYARYLVNNYETVQAQLAQVQKAFNEAAGIQQSERYWSALMTCVIVAVAICRQLDLVRFKLAPLKAWMLERLEENRGQRTEFAADPLELFGKMLADLWQGVLVTYGEGDLRAAPAQLVPNIRPHGQLVGRVILPTADPRNSNQKTVMLLNNVSIKDWCNKHGVSAREMFRACVDAGWAEQALVKYSLGRGTVEYGSTTSYVRCWKLDPDKINGGAGTAINQKLQVISGGLDVAAQQQ